MLWHALQRAQLQWTQGLLSVVSWAACLLYAQVSVPAGAIMPECSLST